MGLAFFLIGIFLVIPTLLGFWFVVYVQKLRKFDASTLENILQQQSAGTGDAAEGEGTRWDGLIVPEEAPAVQKAPEPAPAAPAVGVKKAAAEKPAVIEKAPTPAVRKGTATEQNFNKNQNQAIAEGFSKSKHAQEPSLASTLGYSEKGKAPSRTVEKTDLLTQKMDFVYQMSLSLPSPVSDKLSDSESVASSDLKPVPLMQAIPSEKDSLHKQEYVPADLRARSSYYRATLSLFYILDGALSDHKIFGPGRMVSKGFALARLQSDPKILGLDVSFLSEGKSNLYGQISLIHFESQSYSVSGKVQNQAGTYGLEISCQDAANADCEIRLIPFGAGLPSEAQLQKIADEAARNTLAIYIVLKAFAKVFKQPIDFDTFAQQVIGGEVSINGQAGAEAFMQGYEALRGLPHGGFLANGFFAHSPGLRAPMLLNFPELASLKLPPFFTEFKLSVSNMDYAFTPNELATANLEAPWDAPRVPSEKLLRWLLQLAQKKFPSLSQESCTALVAGTLGLSPDRKEALV